MSVATQHTYKSDSPLNPILSEAFKDLQNKNSQRVLFHYTSLDALEGILKTKKMWATHVRFLNDITEFSHAFDQARKIIKKVDIGSKMFVPFIREMQTRDCYVISFSDDNGDRLSQWRGYCNGGGCSIGFGDNQISQLQTVAKQQGIKTLDAPCIYREDIVRDGMRKSITSMLSRLSQIERQDALAMTTLLRDFFDALVMRAAVAKHPGFSEEEEHRVVFTGGQVNHILGFHRRGSSMIPHAEIRIVDELSRLHFEKIIIGPTKHKEEARKSIEMMLAYYGATCKKIVFSTIPFRSW
jgi:hypothetical protein